MNRVSRITATIAVVLGIALPLIPAAGSAAEQAQDEAKAETQAKADNKSDKQSIDFEREDRNKFFRACWTGNLKTVKDYLDLGMDPDESAHFNPCAVQAARSGQTKVLELLIKRGGDPNIDDVNGWTPLMWAAYQGYDESAEVLLKAGADPDQANKFGDTPLLQAAFEGRDKVARLLLDADADYTLKNDKGFDPMRAANVKGFYNIVNMLIKAGAKPVDKERVPGEKNQAAMPDAPAKTKAEAGAKEAEQE